MAGTAAISSRASGGALMKPSSPATTPEYESAAASG